MSVTVTKTGFNFAALSQKLHRNIAAELNSGVDSGVSIAKQLAAVATGYMRDNISQTEEATPQSLRAVMESGADYSIYPEYGTVNMEAQPFFTPAVESAKKQIINGAARALK